MYTKIGKWFSMAILAFGVSAFAEDKKILLIAGSDSHGGCCHEHSRGVTMLAKALNSSGLAVEATIHTGGWPEDEAIFDGVDAVVIYCDGGKRHVVNPHLESFQKVMDRGVGLGCLHYGVEVPKGPSGDKFLDWIGGYFETDWSVNPHWTADMMVNNDHPAGYGVKPFAVNDEWYFHMRFRKGMRDVTPIFSAVAPPETMKRRDGAHSGNPHVRKSVAAKEQQHLLWVATRENEGRGFGCTGGHFHKNWGEENFRKAILNSIVWIAKGDVPETGVASEKPEDLSDRVLPSKALKKKKKSAGTAEAKHALFASKQINKNTPNHMIEIDVSLKDSKNLWLVCNDAGDGHGCDWASWVKPRFVDAAGKETLLTDLKWVRAQSGFGKVSLNKNSGGQPLMAMGNPIENGIGVHANSTIHYAVPATAIRFMAHGALDNGGTDQGCGSTVQFFVFDKEPKESVSNPVLKQ